MIEAILARFLGDSDLSQDNAYRSVFAMGQLASLTSTSVEALKKACVNREMHGKSVNYNALIQLGRLFSKIDTEQQDLITEAISLYGENFRGLTSAESARYIAMTATGSSMFYKDTLANSKILVINACRKMFAQSLQKLWLFRQDRDTRQREKTSTDSCWKRTTHLPSKAL
ncbi:hypothetical protein CS022_13650 [Veronia nyctiphanis]|uniref:Uncharacterized protein n=2 Tax=Veronia nyctiphanis TaxID=1278244 RepID=A0A4Q0YRX8_9GAMM|nr:hypothetical protein CS022_13650 [Veronia nyctiphanis]